MFTCVGNTYWEVVPWFLLFIAVRKCVYDKDIAKKMIKESYQDSELTIWQCRWAVKKIEKDGAKIELVQSAD